MSAGAADDDFQRWRAFEDEWELAADDRERFDAAKKFAERLIGNGKVKRVGNALVPAAVGLVAASETLRAINRVLSADTKLREVYRRDVGEIVVNCRTALDGVAYRVEERAIKLYQSRGPVFFGHEGAKTHTAAMFGGLMYGVASKSENDRYETWFERGRIVAGAACAQDEVARLAAHTYLGHKAVCDRLEANHRGKNVRERLKWVVGRWADHGVQVP